jgi:preprotein translocase subunit SecG
MLTFILILTVVVCIALVFIVLIQNPKGGGLVSEFSSANQIIGVQKSTDTVEKITWGLASSLFVFCLIATLLGSGQRTETPEKESILKDKVIDLPAAPMPPMNQPNQGGNNEEPNQVPEN